MAKILVIGAGGQLGTELTKALAETYGNEAVIATDFQESVKNKFDYCAFQTLNVMDKAALAAIVEKEGVYHICLYYFVRASQIDSIQSELESETQLITTVISNN